MKKVILTALLASVFGVAHADDAFLTIQGEYQDVHGGNDSRNLNIIPGYKWTQGVLQGVTVDVKAQIEDQDNTTKVSSNFEPRIKYEYVLGSGLKVWGRVSIGEKLATNNNFAYYRIEPGVTYSVNPRLDVFVSDRFSDAFASGKGYETNTPYVGATYKVSTKDSVTADIYRSYVNTESTGLELAYTRWF
jgi:hypothetical protein